MPRVTEPPTQDWRTDAELFAAINRADASAFESLYHRHRDWVVRLAYRFTHNHDDALDVLQETFAYLLRKAPNLTLTAKLTTYLYPAVKNISISLLRERRKAEHHRTEQARVLDEETLTAPPPEHDPSHTDVARLMSVLPEPQREVLLMRFLDDMTTEEIATALEIPQGTVKSRLHNAIKTLRQDERTRDYFAQ